MVRIIYSNPLIILRGVTGAVVKTLENDNTGTGSKPDEKKAVEQQAARREGPGYNPGSIPFPPGSGPAPAPVTIYQPYYVNESSASPKRSSKPGVAGGLLITTGLISIIIGMIAMTVTVGLFGGSFPPGGMDDGTGEVSGQVIFQNMTPAENVTITVTETGQLAVSNATGNYRIIGISSGTHQLKVEYPNYKTILQKVSVGRSMGMGPREASGATHVDFQLTPGEGPITVGSGTTSDEWGMEFARGILSVCSALWILLGILIVAGGYFSLQRRKYPLAVAAGVAGLLTPLCILSMIALVVLFLSGDEFRKGKDTEGTRLPEAKPLESGTKRN